MQDYREVQNGKPWWVVAIVVLVAAFAWVGFIQQILMGQQFGNNPAPDWLVWLIFILIGIGLPVFYFLVRMVVTVDGNAVTITYRPLLRREIPLSDVESVTARDYKPLAEFGGWGIRMRGDKRAYTMQGNRGAELKLRSGQVVLLGSEDAEALAQAIAQRIG